MSKFVRILMQERWNSCNHAKLPNMAYLLLFSINGVKHGSTYSAKFPDEIKMYLGLAGVNTQATYLGADIVADDTNANIESRKGKLYMRLNKSIAH